MSAKPIDEFLQECTGWLEKIAAAKQREEAAYAAINSMQIEKKAFRLAARGMGHVARAAGRVLSAPGRAISRLGQKMVNWGSKPKANNSLKNPLAQQVSSTVGPQTKMVRMPDGTYKAHIPSPKPKPAPAPAPVKPTPPTKPADPAAGKPAPTESAKPTQTNTADPAAGKPTQTKTADPATSVKDPAKSTKTNTTEQQGGQPGAGAEGAAGQPGAGAETAMAQPGMFQKAMPYALAGGAGFLIGRSTAPDPVYMSPAMMHNNMMYQQSQQVAPNIY